MSYPSGPTRSQSVHRSIEVCATWQKKWEEADQPQVSRLEAVFDRQDSSAMDVDEGVELGKDEFADESDSTHCL